jgi:pimeloyl-ACP methyl ester carboxylesterase
MVWRVWGDSQARPVVLLHGGSGSWTHWIRNIPALVGAGYQVWAPDLPGFGDSSELPLGYDADAIVPHLLAGLRVLPVSGPWNVVAFSLGSLVATLLANLQPSIVSRLLLVGLPVLPLESGRGLPLSRIRSVALPAERVAAHRANLAAIMLHRADSIDEFTVALQDANVLRDRMRARRLVTSDVCFKAVQTLIRPFECIWGQEDVLFRDRWCEVLAACQSNSYCTGTQLLPHSGHWVQYEAAVEFNQLMIDWLAK